MLIGFNNFSTDYSKTQMITLSFIMIYLYENLNYWIL